MVVLRFQVAIVWGDGRFLISWCARRASMAPVILEIQTPRFSDFSWYHAWAPTLNVWGGSDV